MLDFHDFFELRELKLWEFSCKSFLRFFEGTEIFVRFDEFSNYRSSNYMSYSIYRKVYIGRYLQGYIDKYRKEKCLEQYRMDKYGIE